MKLAIMSDFHLGFDERDKRQNESFENAAKALEIAIKENVDAVLLAGDIFDSAIPAQEVLYRAMDIFSIVRGKEKKLCIRKIDKDGNERDIEIGGLPIIAIAGTHEYRGKDYKNVVEVLERAGFLVCLHASVAVLEKEREKLAIHGMSGVPEKKALDVLRAWSPKPRENYHNILMMHQSIKEYLPFEDEMIATISISDLPNDFDLVVNGHLHWANKEKIGQNIFLIPGSTIITQMKKLESEKEKGIYIYETQSKDLKFIPLPNQRKLFYHKVELKEASIEEAKKVVESVIESGLKEGNAAIPLIRIKLVGNLKKGVSVSDINFIEIEEKFKDKAILSISREFSAQSFRKKISELRELQKERKSVTALGIEILEKNLKETDFDTAFDARRMFDLLSEQRMDEATAMLLEEKKSRKEKV